MIGRSRCDSPPTHSPRPGSAGGTAPMAAEGNGANGGGPSHAALTIPPMRLGGNSSPPVLELFHDLRPGAAGAVCQAGAEAVFLLHFVLGHEVREVPGGIGRLLLLVDAAAGR